MEYLVIILAAVRLTSLVVDDKIFDSIKKRLGVSFGSIAVEYDSVMGVGKNTVATLEYGSVRRPLPHLLQKNFLGGVLTCKICFGTWVSLFIFLAVLLWGDANVSAVLTPLALSEIINIFNRLKDRI